MALYAPMKHKPARLTNPRRANAQRPAPLQLACRDDAGVFQRLQQRIPRLNASARASHVVARVWVAGAAAGFTPIIERNRGVSHRDGSRITKSFLRPTADSNFTPTGRPGIHGYSDLVAHFVHIADSMWLLG